MKRTRLLAIALAAGGALAAQAEYSFTYGGKAYRDFEGVIDGTLKVSVVRGADKDFAEREYTVWFENVSKKPSAELSDVVAYEGVLAGDRGTVRGILGDHDNFYRPYEHDLAKAPLGFENLSGRATHVTFPYFDVVHGENGTRLALGWAGTWRADFSAAADGVRVKLVSCPGLKGSLLPGERIRTGQVVILDYPGREEHVGVNRWRRWFMKDVLPKADAKGTPLGPFTTYGFMADTGLPNSDGSISETYYTFPRTFARLRHEGLLPDFRWFDAGWYADPAKRTVPKDWWGTVGSWEPDPVKWPKGTLRETTDAGRAAGMKTLCWFEPERVTHVDDLVKNYGYRREWGLKGNQWVTTNNLGDPDCLAWTLGRIVKMMGENGIDFYREDNNSDQSDAWRMRDAAEAKRHGVGRTGFAENLHIQGHYALWDGIIDFCRKNGKCTFVDSCASGGGRNDIESLRRGFPLMRSDYDRTTSGMRLSQTWGFCKWVPYHGSATKETKGQLDGMRGKAPDAYVTRASLLPVWNWSAAVTVDPACDLDGYRRNIALWRGVSGLLTEDYYTLSPWSSPTDGSQWMALAYHNPGTDEAIALVFRRETAKGDAFLLKLPFAKSDRTYVVTDDDRPDASRRLTGAALRAGFEVKLANPRSSALFRIAAAASAEESVRFHAVFTDHMVLQRDQPVVLKGYAQPGAEVCAELGGAKANAKADARGRWRVSLPAMKAGGPHKAKASAGGKTVTLDDVMIGELWLCSGQSNMEMPVWGAGQFYRLTNGLEVAAAADDPDLRIAQINRTDGSKGPVEEPGTDPRWWKGWQRANTAEAVKPFSATAYFFGRELRRRLGVPVGIVASSWGGSKIDPWIAGRSKAGEPVRYNGMIAPLEGLQFRGVAWYQGCADQKEWDRYDDWQRKLVASWRENLGRPDLAFICVQLAGLHENRPDKPFTADELAAVGPTEEGFVHIRAEQDRIRRVKGCECVTAFDIGTANDVHAKNKSEVGRRLAAAAANLCYGAKVPVRGPRPLSFVRDGAAILVKFDAPIRLAGGSIGPREFTLKALGGARTWADAVLVAPDTVRVSSPNVENPLRVDYAWVPCVPKASLYNAEGYPVMPFRKYVADPAHYPRARLGKETVLAHRGMSEEAPENTPAAYEKAVGNGFGFECDVYLTKDGRVFSFHDPDLRRIAGIDKACKDCTWDEVKDLDVGKWKGPEWAGQHPSTFEDIMALARDGRWIEVDVKAGPAVVPYLKKLLAAQGNASPRNMFFASANPRTIRAVREQMPEYGAWLGETCRRGWNAAAPAVPVEKMVEDLRANGASGVCLQFSSDIVTEDYIWALKDAGYPVNVWTVDDPAEARLALERGADTVTSNNPNKLLASRGCKTGMDGTSSLAE